MKLIPISTILLFTFCFFTSTLMAQEDTLRIDLNVEQIRAQILHAPNIQNTESRQSNKLVTLPSLDGKEHTYFVFETVNMEEPLYSQFPEIRSYILIDKEDQSRTGRLSTGGHGLNIMTKKNGAHQFISPLRDEEMYQMYRGTIDRSELTCGVHGFEQIEEDSNQNRSVQSTLNNGATLRTYRIAIAATGEFYQAQGNTNALVLAKINNYLNLLNDIFEDEVSARFNLIGNNTAILFNNPATDGIDPTSVNSQLTTTQTVINNTIGAANYDIGHAFYTIPGTGQGGSGVAALGVVCEDNFKARGWSGGTATVSDALWTGLFAHEIGHQFGAHHSYYGTQSNCVQRSPGNGYEPGSGNSLMSYEGICTSHNITPEVGTFYFHNHSLDQIITEMGSKTCHTSSATNNAIPIVTAPVNKTIPRDTPFELVGSATDGDGDAIIYNWEEFDTDSNTLPAGSALGNPNAAATSTTAPLFRSFDPSTSGHTRTFPIISDIVNATQTMGEILPTVSRNMKFRLTARDFKAGGGAVSCDEVDITVDATMGPFNVTSQPNATTWTANGSNTATVTWNVAGTNTICSNVDILFSIDRGTTFPFTIASNVANNGSHTFTIPSFPTTVGRVKVKCSDNYFFDINLGDITLNSTCDAVSATFTPDTDITAIQGSSGLNLSLAPDFGAAIGNFTGSITATDPLTNISRFSSAGPCQTFGNVNRYDAYDIQVNAAGSYNFNLVGTTPFGTVMRVYENSFNPASPCSNMLVSSYQASNAINGAISVTLNPGLQYVFVVSSFSSTQPTLPAAYDISHTGTLYDGTPPPAANFSYTYIAVNQATGIIAAVNANSNFTSLPAGTYTVHGVSHQNTANINTYVGSTFATFQSDASLLVICASLSLNDITLDIQGTSNCPTNYAGANALSGTFSGTQDYETDGAIESTQIIQAGSIVDYDSGTSITLDAPFEVPNTATLHAFIDGCGGTMINTVEDSEDK